MLSSASSARSATRRTHESRSSSRLCFFSASSSASSSASPRLRVKNHPASPDATRPEDSHPIPPQTPSVAYHSASPRQTHGLFGPGFTAQVLAGHADQRRERSCRYPTAIYKRALVEGTLNKQTREEIQE